MRRIVWFGSLLLLAACAGRKPAEAPPPAIADRCTQVYSPMAQPYATSPRTLDDIDTLARRLRDGGSPLHGVFAAAGPDARMTLETDAERGQPFHAAEDAAIDLLHDPECGNAFSNIVPSMLFTDAAPPADAPLLADYHAEHYEDPKYWRVYLTLKLMEASSEIPQ